jgi:hypothetical protein
MQKTLKRILSVAGFVSLLAITTVHAELLDGTKWKIQVVPDKGASEKGEKEFADKLIFAAGKFTTDTSASKGFQRSAYTAEDESYEIEWEAVLVSDTEGRMTWSGGVTDRTVNGKLECIKKDGSKLYYTFKGTRE